jgi:hypothetical protein
MGRKFEGFKEMNIEKLLGHILGTGTGHFLGQ